MIDEPDAYRCLECDVLVQPGVSVCEDCEEKYGHDRFCFSDQCTCEMIGKIRADERYRMRGGDIRYLRKKAGITQAELAHLSGISLGTVVNTELGKLDMPRQKTLASLRKALAKIGRE